MDNKSDNMVNMLTQEDAERFLWGVDLRVKEEAVKQVLDVARGVVARSKYDLWAEGTFRGWRKRQRVCAKGTVNKIFKKYKQGELAPYVDYLDSTERLASKPGIRHEPAVESDGSGNIAGLVNDGRTDVGFRNPEQALLMLDHLRECFPMPSLRPVRRLWGVELTQSLGRLSMRELLLLGKLRASSAPNSPLWGWIGEWENLGRAFAQQENRIEERLNERLATERKRLPGVQLNQVFVSALLQHALLHAGGGRKIPAEWGVWKEDRAAVLFYGSRDILLAQSDGFIICSCDALHQAYGRGGGMARDRSSGKALQQDG